MREKTRKYYIIGMIVLVSLVILCHIFYQNSFEKSKDISVDEIMQILGYKKTNSELFIYEKTEFELEITVIFDFVASKCYKNNYEFDLMGNVFVKDGEYYLTHELVKTIFNVEIHSDGVEVMKYELHEWTKYKLVAHAGGVVRNGEINSVYTNSVEALIQNYNLGHRLFEFDFNMTTDGVLASVHEWDNFGHLNGESMSYEEWKDFKTNGYPMTEGRYTTMIIDDILDHMVINKDMILITDTKSMDASDEEQIIIFQQIYDKAIVRGEGLIDRIIPQIYNEHMYDVIKEVYDFPSIIYTLYATESSYDTIIDFVLSHDDIKVVTIGYYSQHYSFGFINAFNANDKIVYVFTLNTYEEAQECIDLGIKGFYTDFLLPNDIEVIESLMDK